MKLLLDQGLPRSAAKQRQEGIDTLHVGEIGLSTSHDDKILRRGREDGRVIVTLDAAFSFSACVFEGYLSLGYSHSNRGVEWTKGCKLDKGCGHAP
jgi:predicted nuclease of predicted toxin-antitoxin system